MNFEEVVRDGYAMPLTSPSFHRGPFRFKQREYLVVTYRTDADSLRRVVPEPLEVDSADPLVHFEFIKMPDSTGFGDYTEAGQVIPVTLGGRKGNFVHSMYLDGHAAIAAGREIWGFPKKYGCPELKIDGDALVGTLHYGAVAVATGSMGFKYEEMDTEAARSILEAPNFLLKIIPHVDATPRIIELVEYRCEDVAVREAWTGPAGLQLFGHALARVSDLPVLEVISARHIIADLTLGMGKVVHDYLVSKDMEVEKCPR
ncbi:acetoacetate decarboxylase [Ochrobactrum sp. CGA5]|uniref:acetoacetate decarboxylase n=1 Tax=Ochrobactrum sp. CGA5 TaxID=2583453 RepID=UPI00111E213B|nr:acetoacetate decarboxylase [Ochrobactrum sp. CGA5]